ncbi:MAG: MerR family transcriptional regulator [Chloroflexi bacterium]|nr:MAG: MerR family transcriptional regulator [Chloroflexota bacterium]
MAHGRGDQRDLLGIGEFSSLTGVTISTLRHYHQAGLLVPGDVDSLTGYRRYRSDQLAAARFIRSLRLLEMPLEDIGRLLRADTVEARRVWVVHRERLERRIGRFQRSLALIDEALRDQGAPTPERITEVINQEDEAMIETATCRLMGVTLSVPDIDAAGQFYRRVLGIEFETEEHPGGPRHLNACGGTWRPQEFFLFTLWPGDSSGRQGNISFTVQDVDATWGRALEAGATATCEPYDSGEYPRHAAFIDPFGHYVHIYAA